MHLSVHCIIAYNSQDMETIKCPSASEWVKKIYISYKGMLLINKNSEILQFSTTSEVRQKKQIPSTHVAY